jgi:hypothetical protein
MSKAGSKGPIAPNELDLSDPNNVPDPLTPAHVAALNVTCQFLGKTFYDGDNVCWQGNEWVCTPGGWVKTGQAC